MANPSKIEKHGLEARTLALFKERRTTTDIADRLTADLAERGIDDSITQPTVSRWLKRYRDEAREETTQIITEHIKEKVKNDLVVIDDVEAWHLAVFKGINDPENPEYENYVNLSLKERSEFGMRVVKIIETKLRFALGGPESGGGSCSPVDLSQFRQEVAEMADAD